MSIDERELTAHVNDAERMLRQDTRPAMTTVRGLLLGLRQAEATRDRLLNAAHDAADELDAWDGHPSVTLDGCSPGGVVRHAVHGPRGVSIDECPACNRYRTGGESC